MTGVVADTVTIIWWLTDDERLSEVAVDALQAADAGDGIFISAVTLVDIWYATHKRNDALSVEQLAELDAAIHDRDINIHVLPVTVDVARLAWEPAKADLPDPFDRLIVATAKANGLPLVSPDRLMRNLTVAPAIW